jgi:hypothetical protein
MPTALATLRARLQIVLDDAAAAFWTTAELDEHIQGGLRDLSHRIPRERTTTIATTSGSRDVSLATLTLRVAIIAVEYKTGADPKTFVDFSVWNDTLRLLGAAVPDGSNCIIYWQSLHNIGVGTETLPEDYDEALTFAAAARACDQQDADSTNSLNTGGPAATRDWGSLANHFRSRYEERVRPRRGIRRKRLYAPAEPTPTQSTDPGP